MKEKKSNKKGSFLKNFPLILIILTFILAFFLVLMPILIVAIPFYFIYQFKTRKFEILNPPPLEQVNKKRKTSLIFDLINNANK